MPPKTTTKKPPRKDPLPVATYTPKQATQAETSSKGELTKTKASAGKDAASGKRSITATSPQPPPKRTCTPEEEEPLVEKHTKSDNSNDEFENVPRKVREEVEKQEMIIRDIDLFDCPICLELLRSSVYQCDNGHLACGACCRFVRNKCPTCSLPIGFSRCRAIESIIEAAKITCKNFKYGCLEKVNCLFSEEHEQMCKYSPCRCPCCDFVALPKKLYEHVEDEHDELFEPISLCKPITYYMFPEIERVLFKEKEEGILFVLNRFLYEPLGNLLNVTCIAPSSSDMKFFYDLTHY